MSRPLAFTNVRLVDPASGYDGPGALVVKDGRMYGRGACDMKSGTIGALYALDAIAGKVNP